MIDNAKANHRNIITTLLLILFSVTIATAQKSDEGSIIYFDLNGPSLNAAARQKIDGLLSEHKINKDQKLLLFGYADYLGSRAHNDSLSSSRAMNVRTYLIAKGISEANITVCVGKGAIDRQPVAGQSGFAKDRKVEIISDAARIKTLTCRPLEKCLPLAWSEKVTKLKVHAAPYKLKQEITDKTITVRLPGGDKYVGELSSDGDKTAGGLYEWANNEKYKGDYKNDKKDGQGIYYWPNGDKLDGTWLADEIVAGTLTIPYDGYIYHADNNHSHSEVTYKGSLQYTGAFINHMFNGHGTAVWPNGDRYEGDWVNDKMNGHGIYYWANGEKFDGRWADNIMNGPGVMYSAAGKVTMKGMWINDVFQQ